MAIDAVAGQMPIIGFIDANGQISTRLQSCDNRIGQAAVGGKEDADVPRPFWPADKLRSEGVNGNNGRVGCSELRIGRMIGAVIGLEPARNFNRIGLAICRN